MRTWESVVDCGGGRSVRATRGDMDMGDGRLSWRGGGRSMLIDEVVVVVPDKEPGGGACAYKPARAG